MERRVVYFPDYGEQNTPAVVDCVSRRLDEGDVTTVVVATSSGKTALLLADALAKHHGLRLIAVGNPPGSAYEPIPADNRSTMIARGMIVVDYAPYGCAALQGDAHRNMYGSLDLLVVVADVWRMTGGQGLKVAMEVGLMATNVGVLKPGEKVIAVGGTASGADTAIVMKTALSLDIFSSEPERRPDLLEFLCTPLAKKWW
jgi:uncharacterized protein